MKEFIISSEKELISPVNYLFSNYPDHNIFCLEGQLGAGKTSFVKTALLTLGFTEEATSPTYSIINEYQHENVTIYHMDLYRLNSIDEALDIGIEEYLHSGNRCFIEWHELIIPLLPKNTVNIKIDVSSDITRKILISNLSTDHG